MAAPICFRISLILTLIVHAKGVCDFANGCGCEWATEDTCQPGGDDGSVCWTECCCPFVANDGAGGGGTSGDDSAGGINVAKTTRYWDCCKPSCAWDGNASPLEPGFSPVRTCSAGGGTVDSNAVNICGGGGGDGLGYMCTDQQPWLDESSGTMYAFAAGGSTDCCKCFLLTFLAYSVDDSGVRCDSCSAYDGALADQTMLIQVTNTGTDLAAQHFDIQIPGGGFGLFNGCAENGDDEPTNGPGQFSEPYSVWGGRYGGVSSLSDCAQLPSDLRSGCEFRFGAFQNADNPGATFTRVACPEALVAVSGCKLSDDPVSDVGGGDDAAAGADDGGGGGGGDDGREEAGDDVVSVTDDDVDEEEGDDDGGAEQIGKGGLWPVMFMMFGASSLLLVSGL